MKVTLITHSCVLIELKSCSLLFDYYGGHLDLDKNKPLYVFASHAHSDHYSKAIFNIGHPNIHYILSSDIHTLHSHLSAEPHHHYEIDGLSVDTLFSTDQGVAFIVKADDATVYFAGDLNNWYWEGENEKDNKWQAEHYDQELDSIRNEHFDLACIVVDDRQEKAYLLGLKTFLEKCHADVILPIHYFGHYRISQSLKKEKLDKDVRILYPDHDYYTVEL